MNVCKGEQSYEEAIAFFYSARLGSLAPRNGVLGCLCCLSDRNITLAVCAVERVLSHEHAHAMILKGVSVEEKGRTFDFGAQSPVGVLDRVVGIAYA